MIDLEQLSSDLEERHKTLASWPAVAREYGVSPILGWRIVHEGYEPKRADIRARLGLSPLVLVSTNVENGSFPEGVYLPATARVLRCPTCGRQFIRTSNAQKFCVPQCRKQFTTNQPMSKVERTE